MLVLFEEYIRKKKNICLYPETVLRFGQSLGESLRGGKFVKN